MLDDDAVAFECSSVMSITWHSEHVAEYAYGGL